MSDRNTYNDIVTVFLAGTSHLDQEQLKTMRRNLEALGGGIEKGIKAITEKNHALKQNHSTQALSVLNQDNSVLITSVASILTGRLEKGENIPFQAMEKMGTELAKNIKNLLTSDHKNLDELKTKEFVNNSLKNNF